MNWIKCITIRRKIGNISVWFVLIGMYLILYSCSFKVPKGLEDLGLLLNYLKNGNSSVLEENITVSGTVKDASGNLLPGGILDIAKLGSSNTMLRLVSQVTSDSGGNFSMNISLGTYSIQVSRSDGSSVGKFSLKVNNSSDPPEVLSSTGLQVSNLAASLVGAPTITIFNLPAGVPEGSSATLGARFTGNVVQTYEVTIQSGNSAAVTVSPSSLTFTPENFTTIQNVTLTGLEDANETSETVKISFSSKTISTQTRSVMTLENDTTIIFGTPTGFEGSTVTVPITLSGNPGTSRTVSFSSNNNPPTISPSSMSFTTSNFNNPQILTLTGLTDESTTSLITAQDSNQASSTKLITKTQNISIEKYNIGGTVTGLTGNLVLTNKDSYDTTTVSSNGNFSFPKMASTYAVGVKLYLLGKICLLSNATGVATSAISNIGIMCTSKSYSLGEAGSGLLSTGQTNSYQTGDDGTYRGTLKKSYSDNGDGTVTDNITGLTYQKCSKGQTYDSTCLGTATTANWEDAKSYCTSLSLASKTWRLPSVNELSNLVDYGKTAIPAIDSISFPETQIPYYWSSSANAQTSTLAWGVGFDNGGVGYGPKEPSIYVRCVTGTPSGSSSFTDNGNGTVTDSATGLIWQKCSNGQNSLSCSGTASFLTWSNALTYCEGLTLGGRSDWRLPNINELRSLVDYSKMTTPAINTTVFSETPSVYYWSSSTYVRGTLSAWNIRFNDGLVSYNTKTDIGYIRCITGP